MAQEIGNSNLLEVWATSGQVVEPDISKIEEGWQLGEQPPHEFMNWLQNTFGAKLNHILSNGTPEWNSTTSFTVGSLVKRTGNVWIAMQPNANSEPSDGNVNWSRLLKVGDNVERVVDTISDLLETSVKTVKSVRVLNYHTGLEGGGGVFYWDATKTKSEHNGGTVIDPTVVYPTDWNNQTQLGTWFDTSNSGTGCWVRQHDAVVNVQWFGAKADGVADDTRSIQGAMDVASSNGFEVVELARGTHIISMAASSSPYACLRVPKNIHLKGQGFDQTTITRPITERAVDGVLIVNKNWDTQGGYGADGNITLSGFYITDGAASPTRGLGDLIALVHAENFHCYDLKAGNHDQHFFDICAVRNVLIERCQSENDEHPSAGTAVYQVDSTSGLGVWGAFIDNTNTENITIKDCWGIHRGNSMFVQLNHAANVTYRNINILNNYFEMAGAHIVRSIIQSDNNNVECYGLRIIGNTFKTQFRAINLFNRVHTAYEDIIIADNIWHKDSTGRDGIYVGADGSAENLSRMKNVVIKNNLIRYNHSGIVAAAQPIKTYALIDAIIDGNQVNVFDDTSVDKDIKAIWITGGAERVSVTNNKISLNRPNLATNIGSAIQTTDGTAFDYDYNDLRISNNIIDVRSWALAINHDGNRALMNKVVISGNLFNSESDWTGHHLRDVSGASDGTNGWRQVDLGGTGGALAVSANQQTTVNYGLRVVNNTDARSCAGPRFLLQFANNLENFRVQQEQMVPDVSGNVGTYLSFINVNAGTCIIVTGTGGVNMVLSTLNNQFAVRSNGFLRMWVGV